MPWVGLALWLLQAAGPPPPQGGPGNPPLVLILTTPGAERLYHTPSCELVRNGRDVQALPRAKANALGYKPHSCFDSPATPAGSKAAAKPATPSTNSTIVWVADGSNKYHLAGCQALGANPRKSTVEQAGRDHFPCPVCKPPVRTRPPKGIEVLNWKKKQ